MFTTDSSQCFHSGLMLLWFGSQRSGTRLRSALAQLHPYRLRKIE
jgi:hypothetical protein